MIVPILIPSHTESVNYEKYNMGKKDELSVPIRSSSPSFRIAIIKTMKGEKSNFQMREISKRPSYNIGNKTIKQRNEYVSKNK